VVSGLFVPHQATPTYVKNPTGSMPHLYPNTLSDADVAAIAAYVMTLRR